MQSQDWIELLRIIPKDQHNTLVITTTSGVDLNCEIILKIDEHFLVFRGRVSGNTDEGRAFFIPYRQIDFLQMNRNVKEIEIRTMFGDSTENANAVNLDNAPIGFGGNSGLSPSGSFPAVASNSGSFAGLSATGQAYQNVRAGLTISGMRPDAAGPAGAPGRPANVPAAALIPPVSPGELPAEDSTPTPPRNSILQRLRAQRSSIVPPRPTSR